MRRERNENMEFHPFTVQEDYETWKALEDAQSYLRKRRQYVEANAVVRAMKIILSLAQGKEKQ